MKKILVFLVLATSSAMVAQNGTQKINTQQSKIYWTGSKVIGGSHKGTIHFQYGELVFKKGILTGGKFVADMASLNVTDLSGEGKTKLEGHLKDDDFFGVDKFKTATLTFTKVTSNAEGAYQVQAQMTIKGKTHPVSFVLSADEHSALTSFEVDRTQYGVRYGSGSFFSNLGDKAISDNFTIQVELFY